MHGQQNIKKRYKKVEKKTEDVFGEYQFEFSKRK